MADQFYIDEFDLTPNEDIIKEQEAENLQKERELDVKRKEFTESVREKIASREGKDRTIADVILGPEVEIQGDTSIPLGRYARRIGKKLKGETLPELDSDISVGEGIVTGLVDASIKIPYGVMMLSAEIVDALSDDNIPVDKGMVARLENEFKNSFVGKITDVNEEYKRKSAVSRLTSAFGQLYGLGKAGAELTIKGAQKAQKIANKYITAAKANKVVTPNKQLVKASLKANQLNKMSGKQKFIAGIAGAAGGTAFVADIEDIGTLGDYFKTKDIPYVDIAALDRVDKEEANEDAWRRLSNRFKFGAEGAVVSLPIVYGVGKVANMLRTQGNQLAYSNKKLDQWVDKFGSQFRPRGKKPQTLFEGIQRVKGKQSVGQVIAKDLILDIDQTLGQIAKESKIKLGGPEGKRLIGRLDELLVSTDDIVQDGKIIFGGFDPKKYKEFANFADEIGLNQQQIQALTGQMSKIRENFNLFKNSILRGKNINVGTQEFNKIMSERLRNMFTSEYRIFEKSALVPFMKYRPTADQIENVKKILGRYGKQNGVNYTDAELDILVEDIIKNVKLNPLTKTPEFFLTKASVLDDVQTQLINIADNIKNGKFEPTELIKSKADLRSFQRFFGQKRDIRNTIVNTMQDLSIVAAKDEFYNTVAKESESALKAGGRPVVYNTRLEALKGLPNQKIIASRNGLQIKSPLGEDVYTNPLNGKFTSQTFSDALQFAENNIFDELGKGILWQHLVLIPKGATQISKTILGPFTHTRNFFTASQFAAGTGNLFKRPDKIVSNFRTAFNTIQPQLLYRNLPKDQALYKFLLEEGVVSSSATYKDLMGLLDDIGKSKTGDFYMDFFNKFNSGMKGLGPVGEAAGAVTKGVGKAGKKIYTAASDLYVAEDDFWKIFNFLGEFDTYKNAYRSAFDAGKIAKMPSDLQIMKEAANIVRNTVPNYAYVSDFVKSARRLPLGNFVSFPAEVIRTGYNIIDLGLREAKNPIFKGIGQKRIASFAGTTAVAIPTISAIMKGLYGVTNDMIAAVREFVPDYSKDNAILVYVGKDGLPRYVDASGGYVYDAFTQPATTVIANLEQERVFGPDGQPLVPGLVDGMIRSVGKLLSPFISESIWFETVNDLFVRKGMTAEGYRLWNPEAPLGEKINAAIKYVVRQVGPGSYPQFERLGQAIFDVPGERGQKFETTEELAGFFGFRGVKIDPKKQIGPKINRFQKSVRDTRTLLTGETTKGGPITQDDIIRRFFIANKQRYNAYNKMQRVVKASQILGLKDKDLYEIFGDRNLGNSLGLILQNKFEPFNIGRGTQKVYRDQAEKLKDEFENLDYKTPLTKSTFKKIGQMMKKMSKIPLNSDFDKFIDVNDYLSEPQDKTELPTNVAPLPEQPMPNPQVVQSMPNVIGLTQTGLTPTENALLSEEEKQLRLKQRGISNYG